MMNNHEYRVYTKFFPKSQFAVSQIFWTLKYLKSVKSRNVIALISELQKYEKISEISYSA